MLTRGAAKIPALFAVMAALSLFLFLYHALFLLYVFLFLGRMNFSNKGATEIGIFSPKVTIILNTQ